MDSERRDEPGPRIILGQGVSLSTKDGRTFVVVLKNLSRHGFKLEHLPEPLAPGDEVTLTSPRGIDARAEIIWADGETAGGVFLDAPEPL